MANKYFWQSALVRAIRTVSQNALALISSAVLLTDVNWKYVLSACLLSGVYSMLTSISTGLPEVGGGSDE